MVSEQDQEDADLLILGINSALLRGAKHYNANGRLLRKPEQIIRAMMDEGGVLVEEPSDQRRSAHRVQGR